MPQPIAARALQAAAAGQEQPCAAPGAGGSRACKPAVLTDFLDTCCRWQQALSHVQSDLMLHHSRGVTQEELGLTLSGGVWFGHSPHNCPPSPPAPCWLGPDGGGCEVFAGSKGIAIRGCSLWRAETGRATGGKIPGVCRAAMCGGHKLSLPVCNEP